MKSITSAMPMSNRMTHGRPAFGGAGRLDFALTGLNFAINPMVSSQFGGIVAQSELMTRRKWIWLTLAAGGCGHRDPPVELFPETVAGVWRRTALRDTPVSEAPDPVPRTAVARLETADYEGPGKLEARAYELDSAAVGLDLAQRWRPSADTVFFNRGRYFIVVKWDSAERSALRAFIQDLEKKLTPAAAR